MESVELSNYLHVFLALGATRTICPQYTKLEQEKQKTEEGEGRGGEGREGRGGEVR